MKLNDSFFLSLFQKHSQTFVAIQAVWGWCDFRSLVLCLFLDYYFVLWEWILQWGGGVKTCVFRGGSGFIFCDYHSVISRNYGIIIHSRDFSSYGHDVASGFNK